MERNEDANNLLETLRRELASMIEEGSSEDESHSIGQKKSSQSCDNESEICLASTSSLNRNIPLKDEFPSKNEVLNPSSVTNINDSIQKLQNNLDDSCKTFQKIAENFEKINLGHIANRIKDLDLNEGNSDSVKSIFNDLKQTFDEKYIENRLEELTKEVASKFREHPGEFGDIPEISEFFRICSKLEHELQNLRQQRDDCIYLHKKMVRVTEAACDRVKNIQETIMEEDELQDKD